MVSQYEMRQKYKTGVRRKLTAYFILFLYFTTIILATHLRRGGIFINNFIAQFQLSTSVKE